MLCNLKDRLKDIDLHTEVLSKSCFLEVCISYLNFPVLVGSDGGDVETNKLSFNSLTENCWSNILPWGS